MKRIMAMLMSVVLTLGLTACGHTVGDVDLESGTYIQIGGVVVAKEYPDRRQYAIWDEALNACLQAKYIERKSVTICVITNAGYKVVE